MEKKTYRITFMADLTEDDVRALKKCFYDAMQEAMEIGPCWELQLEEIKDEPEPEVTDLPAWNLKKYEPSLEELLKLPMRHIRDVEKCFEFCKSKQDVLRVLELTPNMFGEWTVEFYDEYKTFTILNTYFDDDEGEFEEEYYYDYPEDWDYDTEWEAEE
jgi:hypothetical protein